MDTLLQMVQTDSDLSTLRGALEAAGLSGVLAGDGSFTLFAPTNDAFAELPQDLLDGLLSDSSKLADILRYHLADDVYMANDLEGLDRLTTMQGNDLSVHQRGDSLYLDEAPVTEANLEASNGVLHKIGKVIVPDDGFSDG